MAKLESNIEASTVKPLAVLLTTGAMNPVHLGHVELLHRAAVALSSRFFVVGAYLSPSHDLYLRGKFGRPAGSQLIDENSWLPSQQRLMLCESIVKDSQLVATGHWECAQEGRWPDFPVVARNLYDVLRSAFPEKKIVVMYCCGSDHFSKCGLHRGLSSDGSIGVCVLSRDGKKFGKDPVSDISGPQNVVAVNVDDATSDFSSTAVRKSISRGDWSQVEVLMGKETASLLRSLHDGSP